MKQNITLNIDDAIIKKAKKIAVDKNTSVSKLVTDYFENLSEDEKKIDIDSLVGILKPKNKSIDIEDIIKNARWEYLKKKHNL